ncbi:hypothetical protein Tco_1016263 [Tanacetum coccineum]|uniref:RNA polymerase alpha subunit n=1 Tax=Tanacetum coccineum TaxID=301880 RepID=A0ABQ5FN61_9ASTR
MDSGQISMEGQFHASHLLVPQNSDISVGHLVQEIPIGVINTWICRIDIDFPQILVNRKLKNEFKCAKSSFSIPNHKVIFFEEKIRAEDGRATLSISIENIVVDDDLYDLRSVEAEFPAIVIDDTVTPQDALPCKSQVSTPINDEIDFRISFDESNDEVRIL